MTDNTFNIKPPESPFDSKDSSTKIPAVILVGNPDAEISDLFSQLGAKTFISGTRRRRFSSQDIREEVVLNNQRVLLINAPGLYELHEMEMQHRVDKLTKVDCDYTLYFVMKADKRGPSKIDLAKMFRINEWIKRTSRACFSFRVIVNQIQSDDVYRMYEADIANDIKSFFKALDDDRKIYGFSFNIKIDRVLLIRVDEEREGVPSKSCNSLIEDILSRKNSSVRRTAPTIIPLNSSGTKMKITANLLLNINNNKYTISSKNPAVVLFGKPGAGKSTLLTQLGATTFKSGVQLRKGLTKDVCEEEVVLNGQRVLLAEVPGLYEPNEKEIQHNANKIIDSLKEGYDYKLYFVMKANNRGPLDDDLKMMFWISARIKQANTITISFRIVVNQIQSDDVYDMYEADMANDKFKSFFKTLNDTMEFPGFSFDIEIDSVLLIRVDGQGVRVPSDLCRCLVEDVIGRTDRLVSTRRNDPTDLPVDNSDSSARIRTNPPLNNSDASRKPYAILMLGKPDSGKSRLFTQLVTKTSRDWFTKGSAKDVCKEECVIMGQRVTLIDMPGLPGLSKPTERIPQNDSRMLIDALSKGYDYKLYYVMKARSSGPDSRDIVAMHKINDCIKQAQGSQVSFRVVVNQITNDETYDMYNQEMADDNFKSFFSSLDTRNQSFDIRIDGVTLLRDEGGLEYNLFADIVSTEYV